jgi:hypothetical protein
MTNVHKLHNRTLYRVNLDVTKQYTFYVEADTLRELDETVESVVESDMYEVATDYKPIVMNYSFSHEYVTCEKSYDEFIKSQNKKD